MITREAYLRALDIVKAYQSQCNYDMKEIEEVLKNDGAELQEVPLDSVGLSTRVITVFKWNATELRLPDMIDAKVKDLANVSEDKLMKCRNMGKKAMEEIKKLCERAGIRMLP
jgi:DNA-directed RNA polymerase alpha subunit